MSDSKRLYFIPIIAHALGHNDPKRAMEDAFDEIKELGSQPEYSEGYQQFLAFVNETLMPPALESERKTQLISNTLQRLIYDLVTDTFRGNLEQKDALINAFRANPEWNTEYERIKKEAQDFLAPVESIEIEVFKDENDIGTLSISDKQSSISSIFPERYSIRLSNGRVLWEGNLTHKDVIWTAAFPEKDLAMAAETETLEPQPTRTIPLLGGELVLLVYAGLESGKLTIKHGQTT